VTDELQKVQEWTKANKITIGAVESKGKGTLGIS